MNEQQRYLLQVMGIDVWQLRQPKQAETLQIDCVIFPLLNDQQQIKAYVLMDSAHLNTKEVVDLFHAMMKAIRFHVGEKIIIRDVTDYIQITNNTSLLILGKANVKYLPAQKPARMVVSFHPFELLQQPLLKSQAWQDLKRFAKMTE